MERLRTWQHAHGSEHFGEDPVHRHMSTQTIFTRSMIVGAAFATALVLGGCADGSPEPQADPVDGAAAEEAPAGAEESPAGALEESADNDSTESGGTDGDGGESTEVSLPDDFPADVPITDGQIIGATAAELPQGRSWMVTVAVEDDAAMDRVRDELLGAGFEETGWTATSSMTLGQFAGDDYEVSVTSSEDAELRLLVGYQVLQPDADG